MPPRNNLAAVHNPKRLPYTLTRETLAPLIIANYLTLDGAPSPTSAWVTHYLADEEVIAFIIAVMDQRGWIPCLADPHSASSMRALHFRRR